MGRAAFALITTHGRFSVDRGCTVEKEKCFTRFDQRSKDPTRNQNEKYFDPADLNDQRPLRLGNGVLHVKTKRKHRRKVQIDRMGYDAPFTRKGGEASAGEGG
jgi:hypothetical protein